MDTMQIPIRWNALLMKYFLVEMFHLNLGSPEKYCNQDWKKRIIRNLLEAEEPYHFPFLHFPGLMKDLEKMVEV